MTGPQADSELPPQSATFCGQRAATVTLWDKKSRENESSGTTIFLPQPVGTSTTCPDVSFNEQFGILLGRRNSSQNYEPKNPPIIRIHPSLLPRNGEKMVRTVVFNC